MLGEGRVCKVGRLAKRTAGVGMVLCAFLATQATAHAAEGRLSPNRLAHHLVVGLLCGAVALVWGCVRGKGNRE